MKVLIQSSLHRKIFILSILVTGYALAFSQPVINALPRWMFTASGYYGVPQSPIDKFVDTEQWGYSAELQYRLQYNKPFLGGIFYNESTLSRYVLKYTQTSGIGDVNVREKANTRRLEVGLSAAFYPEINWLLQPYLIGRAGVAIFQTSSILTDQDTNESIDRISESTSSAPAYGLDFGIHVVPVIWYLRGDVRVGFSGNTSTDYLILDKKNAGPTGYPIDYFVLHSSAGKWLKISIGISYLF
ncbi:MAG: hypothetical protein ABIQ02_14985 [Saprospiraceae bacterium]